MNTPLLVDGDSFCMEQMEEKYIQYVHTSLAAGTQLDMLTDVWIQAIVCGHVRLAQVLLARGYSIRRPIPDLSDTDIFHTAIQVACQVGHLDMIKLLIAYGADIHAFDSKSRSVLMHAVIGDPPPLMAFMHEQRILRASKLDVVKLLIESGANIHSFHVNKRVTAFHVACQYHELEIMQFLVSRGANVHGLTLSGVNALHYAIQANAPPSIPVFQYLLDHHVNPNAKTDRGNTPLQLAINMVKLDKQYVEMVKYLISQAVDPSEVRQHPYFVEVYRRNYPSLICLFWMMVAKQHSPSSWVKLLPTDLFRLLRSFLCIPNNYSFENESAFVLV